MERDLNLIRMILAEVAKSRTYGDIPIPQFDGYAAPDVKYHVKLCEEADYLDIRVSAHDEMPESIIRMTWAGHEALDRLRNNNGH